MGQGKQLVKEDLMLGLQMRVQNISDNGWKRGRENQEGVRQRSGGWHWSGGQMSSTEGRREFKGHIPSEYTY